MMSLGPEAVFPGFFLRGRLAKEQLEKHSVIDPQDLGQTSGHFFAYGLLAVFHFIVYATVMRFFGSFAPSE